MFKRYFSFTLIVFWVSCAVWGFAPAAQAREDLKLGIIELSSVFDAYKRTQDADAALEKEGQAKQQEREKTVSEIRRLKDELELLSESSRENKQKAIDQKIKELQEFDRKARQELRARRDNMVRDILGEIQTVIKSYGQAKGYDLILNGRMIFYSNEQIDVTGDLIKILNDKYEEKTP